MEHIDGVLYEDVLVSQHPSFYSFAVCAFINSTYFVGVAMVAVNPCVCCFTISIHMFSVRSQFQPISQEKSELFLSLCNLLRPASFLRMGKFGWIIVITIFQHEIK